MTAESSPHWAKVPSSSGLTECRGRFMTRLPVQVLSWSMRLVPLSGRFTGSWRGRAAKAESLLSWATTITRKWRGSWAGATPTPIVIENREQAEAIAVDADTKLSIVSQTTFNYNKFQYLVEIISEKGYDINVFNTICNATEERQKETRELAMRSDAMIVIGGRHSSNTQKTF